MNLYDNHPLERIERSECMLTKKMIKGEIMKQKFNERKPFGLKSDGPLP